MLGVDTPIDRRGEMKTERDRLFEIHSDGGSCGRKSQAS